MVMTKCLLFGSWYSWKCWANGPPWAESMWSHRGSRCEYSTLLSVQEPPCLSARMPFWLVFNWFILLQATSLPSSSNRIIFMTKPRRPEYIPLKFISSKQSTPSQSTHTAWCLMSPFPTTRRIKVQRNIVVAITISFLLFIEKSKTWSSKLMQFKEEKKSPKSGIRTHRF